MFVSYECYCALDTCIMILISSIVKFAYFYISQIATYLEKNFLKLIKGL